VVARFPSFFQPLSGKDHGTIRIQQIPYKGQGIGAGANGIAGMAGIFAPTDGGTTYDCADPGPVSAAGSLSGTGEPASNASPASRPNVREAFATGSGATLPHADVRIRKKIAAAGITPFRNERESDADSRRAAFLLYGSIIQPEPHGPDPASPLEMVAKAPHSV
jgi:hypothetical protein